MAKVVARATFHTAIRESFNWLNIVAPAAIAVMGAYFLSGGLAMGSAARGVVGGAMLVAGVVAAVLFIRSMDDVVFELDDAGLRYRAGRRTLALQWGDIEAAQFDLPQKQLTLWASGKSHRMHHYGITHDEFAGVAQFMQARLREHHVPQKAN